MTLATTLFPKRILIDEDGKATNIKLFSFGRPHMRSMHLSWLSFFIAFTGWFAIPPLMPTIKADLQLAPREISKANLTSVSATILARLMIVRQQRLTVTKSTSESRSSSSPLITALLLAASRVHYVIAMGQERPWLDCFFSDPFPSDCPDLYQTPTG